MSKASVLDAPIYTLLTHEPFFGNFLLGCKVSYDRPDVPTAGVQVVKGQIHMVVNTEWFGGMTVKQQVAILKHEILHVLLEHCASRRYGAANHKAKNVAMDCAINQYIENLPDGCVTLETFSKIVKKHAKPFEPWEYYYALIPMNEDKGKGSGGKGGLPDVDHDFMDGGDDSEDSLSQELNRAAVQEQAKRAMSAAAGKIPNGLEGILTALNKAAQLPWKQILRNFIANARATTSVSTRQRINRRFGFDQPGKKKDRKLVLGVCTDSSGSVSDEAYAAFMREIHTLAKSTTITYLIQADCEVQKVDVIKGGKPKPKQLGTRAGYGGTAYQPALTECMKRKCDAIIYFGDMDAADTPTSPGIPVLWVRVGKQEPPGKFGKVLDLA